MSETKALPQDENSVQLSKAPDGQDEMTIHVVWWVQYMARPKKFEVRRRYRAKSLSDLLSVALAEVDRDKCFEHFTKSANLRQIIRDTVFDAQDAEAKGGKS